MARGLKVPMSVEALVVGRTIGSGWAGPTSTDPLSAGQPLGAGVHLHWALPDALATGEATEGGGQPAFPSVPDLWLVTRFSQPMGRATKRPTRSWVVDARTGQVTAFSSAWRHPATDAGRPRLTAVGLQDAEGRVLDDDGQPLPEVDAEVEGTRAWRAAWAAYYRDTPHRFGFHDDLSDNPKGPVSYSVVGWYSSLAEDPLKQAGSAQDRFDFLEDQGWYVPGLERPEDGHGIGVIRPDLDLHKVPELLDQPVRVFEIPREFDPGAPVTGDVDPRPGVVDGPSVVDPGVVRPDIVRPDIVRPGVTLGTGLPGRLPSDVSIRDVRRPDVLDARLGTTGDTTSRGTTVSDGTSDDTHRVPLGVLGRDVRRGDVTLDPAVFDAIRDHLQPELDATPALSTAIEANLPRMLTAGDALTASLVARATTPREHGALRDAETVLDTLATTSVSGTEAMMLATDPRLGFYAELFEDSEPVPDRIYCHGLVVDVNVDGDGGTFEAIGAATVDSELTWSLGDTPHECLAKVMRRNGSDRWLMQALTSLRVPGMGTLNGLPRVVRYLHQQGFDSSDGGYLLERVPVQPEEKARRSFVESADPKPFIGGMLEAGVPSSVVNYALDLQRSPNTRDVGTGLLSTIVGALGLDDTTVAREVDAGMTRGSTSRVMATTSSSREVRGALKELGFAVEAVRGETTAGPQVLLEAEHLLGKRPDTEELLTGWRWVKRPRPRWWQPTAPHLLVQGPKRSRRHGEDGRFDEEGRLVCRTTGMTVTGVGLTSANRTVVSDELAERSTATHILPGTVQELVREAPLLDPVSSRVVAPSPGARNGQVSASRNFETEATFWWNAARPDVDTGEILAASRYEGRLPSKLCITPWRRAWDPLFIEYEARFHPLTNGIRQAFRLGEVEHEAAAPRFDDTPITLTGRAFTTPVAADALGTALSQVAAQAQGDTDAAEVALDAQGLDVLSCTLDGLDRQLREAGHDVRSGALEVVQIRLIDTFGQVVNVDPTRFVRDDDDLVTHDGRDMWLFPPRLPRRARLMFRLRQAGDPEQEASTTASPVAGFLLTDHVEHAVEFFDGDGKSLGQLRHDDVATTKVVWDPAPGAEPAAGSWADPGQIPDATLREMVRGILEQNRREQGSIDNDDDSVLSALIRLLDTVRHTVDHTTATSEHLATLVGRPVAVVRASVEVDVDGGRLPEGLEVRLGSLEQSDDGLFAWFAHDDFTVMHPPHEAVRTLGRRSGPSAGYTADGARIKAITHGYVQADPTVDLPDERRIPLVLLMDPGGGVHATTGILPRKRIALEPDHVKDALAAIAPTFRAGPVIVDPSKPGLPLPGLERFRWEWTRRELPPGNPGNWSESQLEIVSDAALIPARRLELQEGWLRLERE